MFGISSKADLIGPGTLVLTPRSPSTVRHVIGTLACASGETADDVGLESGKALGYPLATAKFGNAVLTFQAVQNDPDLLFA